VGSQDPEHALRLRAATPDLEVVVNHGDQAALALAQPVRAMLFRNL